MYSKKKTYRKKKTYKKRFIKKKRLAVNKPNELTTKRWVSKLALSGNDLISSNGGAAIFTLNDVPNTTEFTNLFDQYMITSIQYRFVIKVDPDYVTTVTNRGLYPFLKWVHDHDDATGPNNSNILEQYPRMQEFVFSSDRPCTRWYYLKPAVANEVFGTVVQTAYAPKWRQWCDNAYPGIQHYGIKYWADQIYAGQQIYLECRYNMKFRGVV